MDSPITLRYRISSHGGNLFVRELVRGEIIARLPSELTTSNPCHTSQIMDLCQQHFAVPPATTSLDDDVIHVMCQLPTPT